MKEKALHNLSDQELLDKAKALKSYTTINTFLIGIMIGVVIYSVFAHTIGLVTLIPLVLIYKLADRSKEYKEVNRLLHARRLK
ncbi:FUSC family protein [Formosa sediminum]|uniref:FUSC family protein n=1 Tax=Formosa sediminum TaxID=2594004 RepID=A0A516GST2_9FLAO|nr:FUSC family protein [Formosa sediminum]QDO94581.1 FUSC family protein [Formosa sediminum]